MDDKTHEQTITAIDQLPDGAVEITTFGDLAAGVRVWLLPATGQCFIGTIAIRGEG